MKIEIDSNSGFCFGVVTAINKAEEELSKSGTLYCLGDIVHNSGEVERLEKKGLKTITHEDYEKLHNVKVLLRAHGEPPTTYHIAERNDIHIIDATCPVVLQLQQRIKNSFSNQSESKPLILIYGKPGHAEVNGLVGQTNGEAIVIQGEQDLDRIDLNRDIVLYSQTTKSIDGLKKIVKAIKERKTTGKFEYFDTICRQVSGRLEKMREFAQSHEAVVFVSGNKSSNGKALFEECLKVNPNSYLVSTSESIPFDKLEKMQSVGICGATSTPSWLMNEIKETLEKKFNHDR